MKSNGKIKKRIFDIIQIGAESDTLSKAFDFFIVIAIFLNIFVIFFETFECSRKYYDLLSEIELITSIIFVVEYCLRLWTADFLYPNQKPYKARIKFVFSFFGIIDLLSFLPYFLPFLLPSGIVAFRLFRVVRIFRLFRLNAQYDAYNIIAEVISEKRNQLFSSVIIIGMLMLASSLFMYSIEHVAQPEAFKNAFSGIWWSTSALLTVGYGDIYPITILGKIMAIVISFLGVGLVSLPTGIISAGFVEKYSKMTATIKYGNSFNQANDTDNFIISAIRHDHNWCNKAIKELVLPPGCMISAIKREGNLIIPDQETVVKCNDVLLIQPIINTN